MSLLLGLLLGLLSANAAQSGVTLAADWCLLDHEERLGSFNSKRLAVYNCPGTTPLLLLPFLWSPIKVTIWCPNGRNAVYAAPNMDRLRSAAHEKEAAWCGWEGLKDRHTCSLQLSPFQHTMLGVDQGCDVNSESSFDYMMLASGFAGLVLFYAAPALSSSIMFRLSCGSALFTAGSLMVLLMILFRFVPHKRTMTAVVAATGSGSLAILRWLTGKWLPPLNQLLLSKAFGLYVLLSAACGAAITYLYDDRRSPKFNTLIKAALRVFGLALVYFSTWMFWPFSACCMGVMLTSLTGPSVVKGSQQVHQALKTASKFIRTPFQGRTPRTRFQPKQPGAPASATDTAPPTPRFMDFDSSVDALPSPHVPARVIPLHLRTPPPEPWAVQPKRRVSTFEETMVKSLVRGRKWGTGGRGGSVQGGGSSVTPLAGEDNFEDFEGVQQRQQQQQVSPLIKSGFLINPLSGRPIKIGGDTYNRLLEEGYRPDVGAGVMLLPDLEEDEGAGAASRGVGVQGGSSGRGRSGGKKLRDSSTSHREKQERDMGGRSGASAEQLSSGSQQPPRFQW